MSATKATNAVKIGRVYLPCNSLKDAVRIWEDYRDSNGYGASDASKVTCCIDGKCYRISYNGRVWTPAGVEVMP